ncbi:putative periplasmic binding protein-like I [Helianthus annuus]|nr:putative periplasmic binding protein-like I [Helianthus annuus]
METRRLKQTAYSFMILMLSFQTRVTAQDIVSHKEMQVGVILDMGSGVGKVIYRSITMAISDFYKANPHYITRIVFNTTDTKGEPLIALYAALELLENTKVQAIIGPDPTVEARFLEGLEEKASVPILSFSPSLFSNQNPYLVQIAQDETIQFKAIAAMIQSFELKNVVLICEDTADGRDMANYIIIAFHDKNIHVTYTSQISTAASDEQIREEFYKFQHMQTTTFVMHARPSLASDIFSMAKEVGMMGEGYVWIVTSKTTNFLNFMNDDALESMQGVVGFKSYFPKSRKLHKFVSKWQKEYYGSNPFKEFQVVGFNGILAYDAVYALAMAVEKVHTKVTGASLLNQMLGIKFQGLGGEFKLMNGRTVSNPIEVINVIGKGDRRVGFWMVSGEFVKEIGKTNSSSNSGLEHIIFPGGTTSILKHRRLLMKGKKLRIIVPGFGVFPNLIKMAVDHRTNQPMLSGFCGDVFNTALNALNYGLDLEFTTYPYVEGRAYSDLIDKIYLKEFDAAIGDITISSNRSRYVDFTIPFSDTGVGTITRNAKRSIWIFLDPLSSNLWLTSGGFFLILGFVIWFIEHRINEEFQGSTIQQTGTALWFAFSTLVFAHREKLKSNLSRFVVMVWVFVVLVLTSSYTATLSSLLTVQEIASNGGRVQLPSVSYELLNRSAKLKSPADYARVLRSGSVGAVIDEILYVKTFISLYPAAEFSLVATSKSTITNGFAFVFQKDSPLTREMSIEIAKLREDGTLKALEEKWLKQPSSLISEDVSAPTQNSLDLYGFRGLFLTSALSMALALLVSMVYLLHEKYWRGKNKMEILRRVLRRSHVQSQESDTEPTI